MAPQPPHIPPVVFPDPKKPEWNNEVAENINSILINIFLGNLNYGKYSEARIKPLSGLQESTIQVMVYEIDGVDGPVGIDEITGAIANCNWPVGSVTLFPDNCVIWNGFGVKPLGYIQ